MAEEAKDEQDSTLESFVSNISVAISTSTPIQTTLQISTTVRYVQFKLYFLSSV